jgi:hypothetical protein
MRTELSSAQLARAIWQRADTLTNGGQVSASFAEWTKQKAIGSTSVKQSLYPKLSVRGDSTVRQN